MKLRVPPRMVPVISLVMVLIVIAVMFSVTVGNPAEVYFAIFKGAYGSTFRVADTFMTITPLVLVGLGAALAFKCRIWNIGYEGQLTFGAIFGTVVALGLPGLPGAVLLPVSFFAAFLGGAGWASIPAILKIRYEVNEIVTTLLMTYIATLFAQYLVYGPLRDLSTGLFRPMSPELPMGARLPILIPGTRLHAGILLSLALVVLFYVILKKTSLGFQIKCVGSNQKAASYAGINVKKTLFLVFLISGGLAGLAGFGEVAGVSFNLTERITPGYGFTGIAVALLGKTDPLGIVLAAILFGTFFTGLGSMQVVFGGYSATLVYVIEGLVILFLLGGEVLGRMGRSR